MGFWCWLMSRLENSRHFDILYSMAVVHCLFQQFFKPPLRVSLLALLKIPYFILLDLTKGES